MTTPETPDRSINVGNRVVTADGHELGRVKQIVDACFEVDVSLAENYWVAANEIEESHGNIVKIRLLKAGIDGVDLQPDASHEGAHLHE